ncbi:GTPase IMAP family member 7 [Triplophysa dalaica]|uniref:GTPase IMAP family member 7 n=1 Tax=Triplophysa dalaica TaxID=1582913 RepID=UPI0024DFC628|nr:GTPase IMAP family member 7 [Triplophysa dalaica]XP_056610029.1 GTPase IMAP family member 7 [Triplophysa dalaica]
MEGSMTSDVYQEVTETLVDTDDGQSEPQEKALTLVLLGSAGAGKSTAVDAILGGPSDCGTGPDTAANTDSQKRRVIVSGRQVTVVDTPECLFIERPAEDVRRQFSLCAAFSTPGPHAFLLCVPIHRPSNLELQILETLEKVFGPEAVSKHTMVVYTRMERLSEDVSLDEYLNTQRVDLLELAQKCGGRHHPLTVETYAEESVKELLEKVEQMVKESGTKFYTCPLLQEAERRVREKEQEILRSRRERGEDDSSMDAEGIRAEAERKVDDLTVEGIADLCVSVPNTSFIRWLWDSVVGWLLSLPNMVRGSTLLGSFVGLFVGGPLGGAMGATVGSVATEMGRRKQKKT